MPLNINNETFLGVVFGEDWVNAHVTAFFEDPNNIPQENRARCWSGGFAEDLIVHFDPLENQYFTISTFHYDGHRAVRRKAQFEACFVIVADDVNEKIPEENARQLPAPTYKLLTSEHSEQWGWVLETPCEDRALVENLLDGLVAQGLSPDGTDPGMKGVTRYVRLPGGSNTKASRLVDGKPFKCRLLEWNPEFFYEMEDLTKAFKIDIFAPRQEKVGQSLSFESDTVKNHPIFKHLKITHIGNDNWISVDCPNVENHSSDDPSGAAVQIQTDGSVHFQCHHGHCNGEKRAKKLTGPKMIRLLDEQFYGGTGALMGECEQYQRSIMAKGIVELKKSMKQEKEESGELIDPFAFDPENFVFITPKNQFFDIRSGCLLFPDGLNNSYLAEFPGGKGKPKAAEIILKGMDKRLSEADGLGWAPTGPCEPSRDNLIMQVGKQRLVNTWPGFEKQPVEGDVSLWLEHAEYLIPDERQREVVLDFLACVVQRPEVKLTFMIGHRGTHRVGKDLFYKPFMKALGIECAREVAIDNVLAGWGDYLKGLKFCIINEVDKAQDKKVANSMKVVVAPTAGGYKTLNLKGGAVVQQKDCMAGIMMSNKRHFIAIEPGDKRYFIVDSWVEPKEGAYYRAISDFIDDRGAEKVLHYLMQRNIAHFRHDQLPYMTEGALEMVQKGKYDYEQDLEELIHDKLPPFHKTWVTSEELRKVVKELDLKCGNNGREEAMRLLGWLKFRGRKKVGGRVLTTPTFYTNGLNEEKSEAKIYDFFEEERSKNKNVFPINKE